MTIARYAARFFIFTALAVLAGATSFAPSGPAYAQGVSVSVEFRQALEPHGRWQRHNRWGEVWIPAKQERDWQPYTRGNWVYTEEWGWYWVAEEEWGWIPYHYGRWYRDREAGWLWIPGDEWGPAWVSWRRGDQRVGWTPLPPDDVIVEVEDDPEAWVFVRTSDVIAPSIFRVVLPRAQRTVYIRETVIVNRTVIVRGGGRVAANPGVPPSYIAVAVGRPLRVSTVQPLVVRGTVGVRGGVEININVNTKDRRDRPRRAVVRTEQRTIQPAKNVPAPQRLPAGETRSDPGPDAPNVLKREAQGPDAAPRPDQRTPATKTDRPKSEQPKADQQKRDAAPKADQKKDDAAPRPDQRTPATKSDRPKSDQPKADQPKADQPKADQQKRDAAPKDDDRPKADRPKADQPKGEQKKRDAAPKDDDRPKADRPKSDQPKAEQKARPAPDAAPRREAPKAQQPKEQPKAERRPAPDGEPKGEKKDKDN